MFDIGFTELLLVGVVALVVVGPERLPSLIRTTLGYIRQFKSSFSHIKSEVERELDLADLKKDMLDNKKSLTRVAGYDELHESLDELRRESRTLTDFSSSEVFDDTDDGVDNEIISRDAKTMQEQEGPQLPDPDAEHDTGIEHDPSDTKDSLK